MTLLPPAGGIQGPEPTALSRPFWDGCRAHELRFMRCAACHRALSTPSEVCPWCVTRSVAWEVSAGIGEIYSHSMVWRPQSPVFPVPYAVAIVELDEGWHLVTNIVDCDVDDVATGLRVEVTFRDVDGWSLPYFRPSPS